MSRSTYSNLSKCIHNILAREIVGAEEVVIRFLDVSQTGDFGYGIGLRASIESFWSQIWLVGKEQNNILSQGNIRCPVPIIFIGLASTLEIVASRWEKDDEYLLELFQWDGAAYLQYGFTIEQLLVTARRVIEGGKAPLPSGLLPKPDDVLRVTSEVRHWLENRRINVTGMLDNFCGALRGERLSSFHLNSQPAISKDHQEMVNRLWAYESLAAELAPANGGIVPLRAAMDEFEQAWSAFDAARKSYRLELESGEVRRDQIESVINQLEKVIAAVRKAIEATYTLDAALQKKKR